MISIVDYGMGNLRSVQKAFESQGFEANITRNRNEIMNSAGVVLPGVGAFGDCIKNLKHFKLMEAVDAIIQEGKPYLGICLGLQILFEQSEESPGIMGLGLLRGKVIRFDFPNEKLKIPHMGWNRIEINNYHPILEGIPNGSWFYFVHSFYPAPEDKQIIVTTTQYGTTFVSAVCKENVFACQFHPEKSSTQGLKILSNFAHLCYGNRREMVETV